MKASDIWVNAQNVDKSKVRTFLSTLPFGPGDVVGDGVTDNRAALQALHDALPDDGGTILLPEGTIVAAPDATTGKIVEITKPNVRFVGQGMDRTIIKIPDKHGEYVGFFYPETPATDISGFYLADMTLDSNGANYTIDDVSELQGS